MSRTTGKLGRAWHRCMGGAWGVTLVLCGGCCWGGVGACPGGILPWQSYPRAVKRIFICAIKNISFHKSG